jgi:ligand-binding SRPBCC domain-containing protein
MPELFVHRSHMAASAQALYDFHAEPDALQRLTPPWENAKVVEQTGGIEDLGSQVKIQLRVGPITQTWTAEHAACEPGKMFRDAMISGPFRKWEHTHLFIPDGQNASWLEDRVEYEFPLGWLGKLVAGAYTRRRLTRMFEYRHRVTAEALLKKSPNIA